MPWLRTNPKSEELRTAELFERDMQALREYPDGWRKRTPKINGTDLSLKSP